MARKYDNEYKEQDVKQAKEIGGAKAAKELGIPEGTFSDIQFAGSYGFQPCMDGSFGDS